MILAQLSDSHIISEKSSNDKENSRLKSLIQCVESINSLNPLPDAVIHTGDLTHNGKKEEFRIVFDILNTLKMPFYPTPGNKDGSIPLIESCPNNIAISPNGKFVIYAVDLHDIRLVSLDSFSTHSKKGNFTKEKLNYLDDLLYKKPNFPTALFLHHPPFNVKTSVGNFFEYDKKETVNDFNEIVSKHSQLVALFCGHVHRDYTTKIGNVYAHSVPPLAIDLRFGSYSEDKSNQTLYYVYHYSDKTGFKAEKHWVNV